jgi:hypothetical protein
MVFTIAFVYAREVYCIACTRALFIPKTNHLQRIATGGFIRMVIEGLLFDEFDFKDRHTILMNP